MRFYSEICVGWFAIDASGDGAVVLTCEKDVEEGDGLVHFLLSCELDTRMNSILLLTTENTCLPFKESLMELSDPDKQADAVATVEPREKQKSNEMSQNILAI